MTREELLNSPFNWFSKNEVLYIIDELESRTCENCKYFKKRSLKNYGGACDKFKFMIPIDFGCNQFEAKTVSTDTKSH